MTQITDVEVPRGRAKLAVAITLFLVVLLFMNYGAGKLADLLAFQMWPRHFNFTEIHTRSFPGNGQNQIRRPPLPGFDIAICDIKVST